MVLESSLVKMISELSFIFSDIISNGFDCDSFSFVDYLLYCQDVFKELQSKESIMHQIPKTDAIVILKSDLVSKIPIKECMSSIQLSSINNTIENRLVEFFNDFDPDTGVTDSSKSSVDIELVE